MEDTQVGTSTRDTAVETPSRGSEAKEAPTATRRTSAPFRDTTLTRATRAATSATTARRSILTTSSTKGGTPKAATTGRPTPATPTAGPRAVRIITKALRVTTTKVTRMRSGFKNVYHKEEYSHSQDFYDDSDDKKYHSNFDDFDRYFDAHRGNDYKGGHYKGGHNQDAYGHRGHQQKAQHHDDHADYDDHYGDKALSGHKSLHGHRGGHQAHHGHGGHAGGFGHSGHVGKFIHGGHGAGYGHAGHGGGYGGHGTPTAPRSFFEKRPEASDPSAVSADRVTQASATQGIEVYGIHAITRRIPDESLSGWCGYGFVTADT
nr:WW domain-containing protein C660.06-like [Penaeus vannamei]